MELSKRYNPKDVEEKWYQYWDENNFFQPKDDPKAPTYTIVIPPPNITGVLHMGHALNNTIQDVLIRFKRMQGFRTLWIPGTDHAGIATQNMVEKSLHKKNKKRTDYSQEEFINLIWEWKEKHGNTIIGQLKKLGCSCDWSRERFTMDERLSYAVFESFKRLYDKGLIYQGEYIINWCPRCRTALSDEEAEKQEQDGVLYYIRYPIIDSDESLVVATTRPETMLGDTAVAVNPKDKRYKKYIGKNIKLPLTDRVIPIIADEFVDPGFGTGAVKVTPAHDPNDFQMGQKHSLEFVVIMDELAVMNKEAGKKYEGMDRFKCRKQVIQDLQKQALFVEKKPHRHAVGRCYRCETIVEPYISNQWFVKMEPLARAAIKVVEEGKIKFY
ncbi:class I tRNA ligase family protein, partial [PVC group bacterium]|nr:class I tRNA ligase family protein [PVC group bacterium]